MSTTDSAVCAICPHHCRLREGQYGRCGARVARGGAVVLAAPGRLSSLALDPVEKKPFAAWQSGRTILSVGQYGCNMRCPFCQNHSIAQVRDPAPAGRRVAAHELRDEALRLRSRRNVGLCFTYNEPLIAMEYVREAFTLAREAGLLTALVTNGCVTAAGRAPLLPLTDAWNIDLKCFTVEGYRRLGGDLDAVRDTIEAAAATAHVEVTTLVVPGFNDSPDEIDALAAWLASVRPDIPLHLTRFFPQHRLTDRPPTPIPTLTALRDIARRHLSQVLLGNV
ncbi:MAG: AmmeMemoRadiSam system radical SAM enzyme [Bacillota bacterium]|nr:AmmeMemoRadiSam system radical SAM enzyme [Bacillota bacterium]